MRWLELALFAIALAVAGLVISALLWAGEGPYRELAVANGVRSYEFVLQPPLSRHVMDLNGGVILHEQWSRYVTGASAQPPRPDPPLYTDDEYRHMADVRGVFDLAKFFIPIGVLVVIVRLQRARARGGRAMWLLVRDGGLAAATAVAAIGVIAVVAFEPLFLAFHYVFFPQGNFLFDPQTSNLIRLYPQWYWEGISLRVGLSFIACVLALAAVAHLRLRTAK